VVFGIRSIAFAVLAFAPAAYCQLQISTASLPAGAVGSNYSATVSSNGDKATQWSISAGALPPGLGIGAIGSSTSISGTPTAGGNYTFTVKAVDGVVGTVGPQSTTKQFSIAIAQITTQSPLPGALLGIQYSTSFTAVDGAGGTFTWSTTSPLAGLTLSTTGVLSGMPSNTGTFPIQVVAFDQKQQIPVSMTFSLTVAAALAIPTLSPLPSGFVGTAYSANIGASGGFLPYTFSVGGNTSVPIPPAPGLTLGSSGNVSGTPTTAGTFTFTVQVTDNQNFAISKQFQITIAPAAPLLQVSPQRLSFSGLVGGDAAPAQVLSIIATGTAQVNYQITVDNGVANTPVPWITVKPVTGAAPVGIRVVADPGKMGVGTYAATIHIAIPNNTFQNPIDVPVTFNVSVSGPTLAVSPTSLNFGARVQASSTQDQIVVVRNNGGGGPVSFSATVVGKSTWITSATPAQGQTAPNAPVLVHVVVNSQGLAVGYYHDILRITSPIGPIDVAITLFVSSQGSIIGLTANGLRFGARQSNGTSRPEVVDVLNLGDVSASLNPTVEILSGSDWLKIASAGAVPRSIVTSILTLTAGGDATSLPVGGAYALVRVSDPSAINSPQYLVALLDVQPAATPASPDPSPPGLFFTATTAAQNISIYVSSATPLAFQASPATTDGGVWLSVSPASGITSTQNPGTLSVQINAAGLAPGIYTGTLNISIGGVLRSVNVTLAIPSAPGLLSRDRTGVSPSPLATGCSPNKLAIAQTGIANNFSVPAGWPASLIVQLYDDCGNAISTGSVVASFSNTDPPLTLRGDKTTNIYSATWQPGVVTPTVSITVNAAAAPLSAAVAQFEGGINVNNTPAPTLVPNGTLHIFFDVPTANALGNGLAPGNVAQVYGTGMASAAQSPGVIPLLNQFNGTFMLIGAIQAPLFYVSSTLIDAQVPAELTPNRQYAAIVSANGALTLPETVTIVPYQPGMAAFVDGTVIAQHVLDSYSLVTASHPAKPGEPLVIYLAGMGATNPAVTSGQPTPGQLVPANAQPTVTLDGQHVDVGYAGLTPGGVGLYQINLTVPSAAKSGNLDLIVIQSGMSANTTKLPVSN
jgi:large repetitive protein